ncbi:hypothetical protein J8273_8125 [Carpediemonas membranifera]|uniref:Uncharacterized protein n=1 Tax=Carpediemonas membranifera TaxID=201153 RepID=A0A8J6APW0_9EUKA|nr:hypothetical protein J8273_8125 [Carpediemonas membranifera]|eukprot:KAG9390088.1 hypothetical protein J8273_8125 [Carpediemonas membranifera]
MEADAPNEEAPDTPVASLENLATLENVLADLRLEEGLKLAMQQTIPLGVQLPLNPEEMSPPLTSLSQYPFWSDKKALDETFQRQWVPLLQPYVDTDKPVPADIVTKLGDIFLMMKQTYCLFDTDPCPDSPLGTLFINAPHGKTSAISTAWSEASSPEGSVTLIDLSNVEEEEVVSSLGVDVEVLSVDDIESYGMTMPSANPMSAALMESDEFSSNSEDDL